MVILPNFFFNKYKHIIIYKIKSTLQMKPTKITIFFLKI